MIKNYEEIFFKNERNKLFLRMITKGEELRLIKKKIIFLDFFQVLRFEMQKNLLENKKIPLLENSF